MDNNITDLINPAPDPWSELFEAGTPNNTHAPPGLRTSNHDEEDGQSGSGSDSDDASRASTTGRKRNRKAETYDGDEPLRIN